MLISGRRGLHRWPVRTEAEGARSRLRVGPPELLIPASLGPAALSADGHTLAAVNLGRAEVILHDLREHKTRVLGRHEGGHYAALSPDGRWVASGVWSGPTCPIKVRVWDARAGACVRSLGLAEVNGDARVQFTGDGRWLVSTTRQEYRFWEAGSWEPGRELAKERGGNLLVALGAARDGSLLAVARARSAVQLLDASGDELATLTCPDQQSVFGTNFSPDGGLLAVCCDNQIVYVWDLRRLREELGKLGLDWDGPPAAPARGIPVGQRKPPGKPRWLTGGRRLLSSSDDRPGPAVSVRDIEHLAPLERLEHDFRGPQLQRVGALEPVRRRDDDDGHS